jgi:prepilin-type processing-associated H-X9-DG protein/prepilin-type N-terminal cleavage/methylation domain-containing protein
MSYNIAMLTSRRRPKREGFTLVELLVVAAIIALLIALLLPAVSSAREYGRQATCGTRFHGLGQAMASYCATYNDWLPGSPNTSGNGANPGGVGLSLYPGYYPCPPETEQTWPAIHIFDWSNPLLAMMGTAIPQSIPERYDLSKRWAFLCPSNSWEAKLNHASRINIDTLVSSYATCKFFTYVPASMRTGSVAGTLFWGHKFVPDNYLPKITRMENASWKVFLADSCKIDRGDPRRIINTDYGYTTRGAWLNVDDPEDKETTNLSYRFEFGREHSYRHRGGINLLFFDGHVEFQPEGSSEDNNGFGSGSRQAKFWFPSETDTRNLPSASQFNNPKLIVP